MSTNYDELSDLAERGELRVKSGTVRRGPDAALAAQGLLSEATGATNWEELTQLVIGRPSVGSEAGPSPTVRARVPKALKDGVIELAKREHVKESDVVREAIAAYLKEKVAS